MKLSDEQRAWAESWLHAMESGALTPPKDVHDAVAWDTYWTNHIKAGPIEQSFSDMMSSDEGLVPLLVDRHARTILCAGNGLSTEALSLAMHGFQVTALDISTVAREMAREALAATLAIPGTRVLQLPVSG